MTIVLFEDDKVTQLYPVTVGRPAFNIGCGSYRLLDLVAGLGHSVRVQVRPHLRQLAEQDQLGSTLQGASGGDRVALLNGRLIPSVSAIDEVKRLLDAGRPGVVYAAGPAGDKPPGARHQPVALDEVALAVLPAGTPPPPDDATPRQLAEYLQAPPLDPLDARPLALFDYPHDIIRHHLAILGANLEHRLATGNYQELADGVFAGAEARLGQYVVTDTRNGPIVLEERASIGPHCFLSGPAHVGAAARVIEHAAIKDSVALGHTTKIGGEVEGSVIEPYTNKQHHGFLGHSYLGSWINLGAGTCNSDLKNTYGQVNMEYNGRKVPTAMQFLGCIVGDYAKTAINTGIFTGKTIGTCSMVYGFVTTNVPSFTNYARSFGQVTEAPVEVMVATQARMFARRNVEQRPCDVQLLHDMYEITRHERRIAGEPLSL
ncbi:MAG: putative sugar nucleotidyl transferase [Pirellulales bacterium]